MAGSKFDKIKNTDAKDTAKYRDVYEEQQLDRSRLEPASQVGFRVAQVFLAILSYAAVFFCERVIASIISRFASAVRAGSLSVTTSTIPIFSLPNKLIEWSIIIGGGTLFFAIVNFYITNNNKAQKLLEDGSDINQYHNDNRLSFPQELLETFDIFPDAGAHTSVLPSSMISHVSLKKKGLKNVQLGVRAKEDIKDADGDIEVFKHELLYDEDGNPISKSVPIIDEAFGDDIFKLSNIPKEFRTKFDTTAIAYNPGGKNRDKAKYDVMSDFINADWEFPIYEPQRPGGVYIVDTAPVNTMV